MVRSGPFIYTVFAVDTYTTKRKLNIVRNSQAITLPSILPSTNIIIALIQLNRVLGHFSLFSKLLFKLLLCRLKA